jgi:negative regulator of genetic competence, sporulation and motility
MLKSKRLGAAFIVTGMMAITCTAAAQQSNELVTKEEVKADISEAIQAIKEYTVQEKDKALAAARDALAKLDAEIARRESALRDSWANLENDAREEYAEEVEELQAARNRLSERVGALEAGTTDAWSELKTGFVNAYDAFKARWNEADSDD